MKKLSVVLGLFLFSVTFQSCSLGTIFSPKTCNSTQCSSYNKQGQPCGNRTTNCNGRCHLHQ